MGSVIYLTDVGRPIVSPGPAVTLVDGKRNPSLAEMHTAGSEHQTKAKLAALGNLHPLSTCMPDARATRLAELKAQLHALSEEGRAMAPGSPEREAVLERWAPIHAAVLNELSEERNEACYGLY